MKATSRLAAALALAFAFSTLTGAAFAGKPDDPGKSEEAPGQVKKAEPAPEPAAPALAAQPSSESQGKAASAPGQTKTGKAATPSKGKSASAPGQTKTGKAATPSKGKSAQAKAKQQAGPAGVNAQGEGQLRTNQKKVLICHSTGSETNPFVVISVSVNALKSGHDQLGTREAVLAPSATQPGRVTAEVHGGRNDIILGPSSPGRIENKAELEAQCLQLAGIQQAPPPEQPKPEEQAQLQPAEAVGEVAGAQAVVTPSAAPAPEQPAGVLGALGQAEAPPERPAGVLGALGAVGQAELPFTGLPLWIAALIGIALVSAGFGARRAMR